MAEKRRWSDLVLNVPRVAGYLCHHYRYHFTPNQLGLLAECVTRTSHLPGPIVEVGCFRGYTTVWLNKHLDDLGIDKPYYALDTFSGFQPDDVEHEVEARGKDRKTLSQAFTDNSVKFFETCLARNGVHRVEAVPADAETFDYERFDQVSFALIDVDLYKPVRAALEGLWPRMAPGGIIAVDDCAQDQLYDGADQAFSEFAQCRSLDRHIAHSKLGILHKPSERRPTGQKLPTPLSRSLTTSADAANDRI